VAHKTAKSINALGHLGAMNGRTTKDNKNNNDYSASLPVASCQRPSNTTKGPTKIHNTRKNASGCSIKLEWQKLITAQERNE